MASFSRKSLIIFVVGILVIILIPILFFYQPDRHRDFLMERYGLYCSEQIEVQGMEVHYCDEGEGPVILLLHGTAASLHTWSDWALMLRKDYRVIRVDLPGFGITGPHVAADYSAASYVSFVNAVADSLALTEFYLVGNSLGGMIAWHYAASYPDRVAGLVLLDPSGLPQEGEAPMALRLAQNSLTKPVVRYLTPRFLVEKSLREVYYADSLITEELIERYYDLLLRDGNRQAFIDRANTSYSFNPSLFEKITAPTLVIWGKEDVWIPAADADRYAEYIPGAQVHVFDHAGHIPMEEIPEASARVCMEFLERAQSSDSADLR